MASAKNWDVDEDMVELVYEVYVFEQGLKREAENQMRALVNMDREVPKALEDLKSRTHNHHMLRHSRIPSRLRTFLKEYREKYFDAVGMQLPEATVTWKPK